MDLATELCGLKLEHPLMNAAGTCKTLEDLRWMASMPVSALVVGSITVDERLIDYGRRRYSRTPHSSLNAMMLPNPGESYYREHLSEMKHIAQEAGKPLMLSLAGFSPEEFADLAAVGVEGGVDLIELDFGSMTVWKESGQERIITFDPTLFHEIWRRVEMRVNDAVPVGVKLAPVSDPAYLMELAGHMELLGVRFVTASNTFPNGHEGWYEAGVGYGGVGGPGMRLIALGQVKQLRERLSEEIDVIGVGGIESADDVVGYLQAGACATQLATSLQDRKEINQGAGLVMPGIVKRLEQHPVFKEGIHIG